MKISEYNGSRDLKETDGWKCILHDEHDGAFSPPSNCFMRTPPTLTKYGCDKLIGHKIIQIQKGLGSYGMGGCGWHGIKLDDDIGLMLVYAMWGAGGWIHYPLHNNKSLETSVSWTIDKIILLDNELRISCTDSEGKAVEILANETSVGKPDRTWKWHAENKKMGDMWFCGKSDSDYWSC